MKTNTHITILLCFLGVLQTNCAPLGSNESSVEPEHPSIDEPKASSAKQSLNIQPSIIWPQRTLRVCFRTPTVTTVQREIVKNAAHEWEKASSLRFTGFGNCSVPVTNAEIGILQDETLSPHGMGGPPYAAISLRFTYVNEPSGCGSSTTAAELCLMNDAIHELGHVLGFAHEQIRTDVRSDYPSLLSLSSCSFQFADGAINPAPHGPWDLFSVMNYCNPNDFAVGNFAPLSETDKSGVASKYGRWTTFADVNADGRADAIIVNANNIVVRLSTGSNFSATRQTFSTTPFFGNLGTYFADVDADSRADAIAVSDTTVIVRRSNGTSFGAAETWLTVPSGKGTYGRHGAFFADVTGDGRADQIIADETGVFVRRSLAPGAFGSSETWLSASSFPPDTTILNGGFAWSHVPFSFLIKVANVTSGDSRADLILFTQTSTLVFRSTGSAFDTTSTTNWASSFFGHRATDVADVNGDGRKDLVISNRAGLAGSSGTLRARISNGTSSFGAIINASADEYFGARGMNFANVDGIAGDEAITVNDNTIVVRRPTATGVYALTREDWSGPFHPGVRLTLTGAKFAVWRPDDFAFSAFKTNSSDTVFEQWGAANDLPVPADYDRDGLVDIAVWRPSSGVWYFVRSSDHSMGAQQWGAPTDVPVPADYDGDGFVDIAVWRPGTGEWFVISSITGAQMTPTISFGSGALGDIPVPGRYDGDNKVDFAVWRPGAQAHFHVRRSSDGVASNPLAWGATGDLPVPGDYNGDGRTEYAVWRTAGIDVGKWFIRDGVSFAQFQHQQFGAANDIPVPGRYFGTNRTDYAVYRPAFGEFHSRDAQTGQQDISLWGRTQDTPLVATCSGYPVLIPIAPGSSTLKVGAWGCY